jgi:PAS domain S-box-containing protein
MHDEEGRRRRWNRSLREVTGYTDAGIGAMYRTEFVPETHSDRVAATIH